MEVTTRHGVDFLYMSRRIFTSRSVHYEDDLMKFYYDMPYETTHKTIVMHGKLHEQYKNSNSQCRGPDFTAIEVCVME